jgi:phospholipid transport system transporter-binding protein
VKLDVKRITTDNAAALIDAGARAIRGGDATFDLAAVTEVDSSAVALLLAWSREAQAAGATLRLEGLPEDIVSLARLYGVDQLLGLARPDAAARANP